VAWLGFIVATVLLGARLRGLERAAGPAWRPQAILDIGLVVVSLIAAHVEGIGLGRLGFCLPAHPVWGRAIAGGLLLGGSTTLVILLAGLRGLRPVVGGYSFGAVLFWVWIVSSVSEEIFCRGWFQASTEGGAGLSALLPSAILFGAMHLVLLVARVDIGSTTVIVAATSLLGLLAAWARAGSGSLYPAIAAHLAFNVGGVLGGGGYLAFRSWSAGGWG
jgi:membrane protease YdiL (CAAX protease family)